MTKTRTKSVLSLVRKLATRCNGAIGREAEYGMPEISVQEIRLTQAAMPDTPEGRAYRDRFDDLVLPEAYLNDSCVEVVPAQRVLDVIMPTLKVAGVTLDEYKAYTHTLEVPHSPFVGRALAYVVDRSHKLGVDMLDERPRTQTAWVKGHLARHHEHLEVAATLHAVDYFEGVDGTICVLELNALALRALTRTRYGVIPLVDRLKVILGLLEKGQAHQATVRSVVLLLKAHGGDPVADELHDKAQRVMLDATMGPARVGPLLAAVRSALADAER